MQQCVTMFVYVHFTYPRCVVRALPTTLRVLDKDDVIISMLMSKSLVELHVPLTIDPKSDTLTGVGEQNLTKNVCNCVRMSCASLNFCCGGKRKEMYR